MIYYQSQYKPISPTEIGAMKFAFLFSRTVSFGDFRLVLSSGWPPTAPPGFKSPWISDFLRVFASSGLWLNERRKTLSLVFVRRYEALESAVFERRKLRDLPGLVGNPSTLHSALIPLLMASLRLLTSPFFSSAVLRIKRTICVTEHWVSLGGKSYTNVRFSTESGIQCGTSGLERESYQLHKLHRRYVRNTTNWMLYTFKWLSLYTKLACWGIRAQLVRALHQYLARLMSSNPVY